MPSADEKHEKDGRFPTGEWTGFYVQPDTRQRHVMELFLQFGRDRIAGEGDDPVGKFTITGQYDTKTGKCSWAKKYVGQHSVEYTGESRARGIIGHWRIAGMPIFWSGPFFIWPKTFGDQESEFEKAFVEYDLTSQLEPTPF
jgi:hypothetical protein